MTSKGDVKLPTTVQFCEALGKTPMETCKMVQDHDRTKEMLMIDSIRFQQLRHSPYILHTALTWL